MSHTDKGSSLKILAIAKWGTQFSEKCVSIKMNSFDCLYETLIVPSVKNVAEKAIFPIF